MMSILFLFKRYKNTQEKDLYAFFKNVLGYFPRHSELYHIAFIHKSKSQELPKGHRVNNERMEYLGDAVLGAIVADYLYKKYPYKEEGFLTELRSKIVSRANLNKLAHKIGLSQLIQYNHDSQSLFKSIDGDAFEALVGAMYLDRGYIFTRRIIIDKVMTVYLDIDAMSQTDWNFKSKLIDWGQKERKKVSFEVVNVFYQGHNSRRQYEIRVLIDTEPYETAIDYSIKSAEQLAAEKTYKKLQAEGVIRPHSTH